MSVGTRIVSEFGESAINQKNRRHHTYRYKSAAIVLIDTRYIRVCRYELVLISHIQYKNGTKRVDAGM